MFLTFFERRAFKRVNCMRPVALKCQNDIFFFVTGSHFAFAVCGLDLRHVLTLTSNLKS